MQGVWHAACLWQSMRRFLAAIVFIGCVISLRSADTSPLYIEHLQALPTPPLAFIGPDHTLLIGRFDQSNGEARFGWTQSTVRARFAGTSIGVELSEVNHGGHHNVLSVKLD